MSITRSSSSLKVTAPAPPPSPIPTAAGSRSAANEILSRFLEKSLHVPDLVLPESPQVQGQNSRHHHLVPVEIDLQCLKSKNPDSIDLMLRSSADYAAFRIGGCEFFGEKLGLLLAKEAEPVFRILKRREFGLSVGFGDREEIVWVQSDKGKMEKEWARKCIGDERYGNFSEIMDDVASKLGAIAEQVSYIFMENIGKQFEKKVHGKESVLSLYRYSPVVIADQKSPPPPLNDEQNYKSCDYTLSLHLPVQQCGFCVHTGQGPVPFHASPDSIVVTIGRQLEEWSLGKFKCASGEVIVESSFHESPPSFSLEFKYSSSDTSQSVSKVIRTISIPDQLFIALLICLLYNFFAFLFS